MGNYIKNALLEGGHHKKLREEYKAVVAKWDKTGLLEGLEGDYNKSSMAILLENQARQLIDEASKTSSSQNSEEWSGVALPLVRRIFAEIAAQDFVSVQPMNLPSGLVFFLDFKYGSNVGGRNKGASLGGTTGPNSPIGSSSPYPVGGFYGAGAFDYTMPTSSAAGTVVDSATTLADLNYDTDFSASNAGNLVTLTYTSTAGLSRADQNSVRAWSLETGSLPALNTYTGSTGAPVTADRANSPISGGRIFRRFTTSGSGNVIKFVVSGGIDATANSTGNTEGAPYAGDFNLFYYTQPVDYNRGDFEDGNYNSGDAGAGVDLPIPEINLEMKSLPIVAKTRKLKAIWTPELAQDLNAYHSVDAEAELTAMLSEYISMEIDLEILDMLIAEAVTTDYWSAKVGYDWDASSSAFVSNLNATNALAYTKKEWYQTFGQKIQKVSNKIHQLTLRGGANFVVCSPSVATIIESIEGFGAQTDGNKADFAMGVRQVGSLSNRWTVYKNPYMTENTVLIGFRGSNFLETGAVYAPYVPLIMTPLVYDPTNFTPRKGVMTRYAKKMVRPEFYAKIYVNGLETI